MMLEQLWVFWFFLMVASLPPPNNPSLAGRLGIGG